jgi:phosphoserine phosphatase
MSKIVLINVSGHDQPGLTASLTGMLSRDGVRILDIGQRVAATVVPMTTTQPIP